MKTEAKILICYNSPVSIFPVYNGKPVTDEPKEIDLSEKSFLKELNIIRRSLSEFYTEVETLAIYRDVQKSINNINKFNPDVIYNFVESVEGIASYEWCMAGLFELLGFEYTGCNPASLGNCLNKARAKNILNSRGIITPHHITLNPN
ncbi:MAG: D-alanine--D-alanine ligase, partial [Ignavibacteria bacterium]|nr:D-alanine--D-alanine ligase [Ignavibacteria bacterium]